MDQTQRRESDVRHRTAAPVVLASLACLYFLAALIKAMIFQRARHKLGKLKDVPIDRVPARLPSLTLVIPVRNEAETVGAALRTLFALDYPALEWILLNDRSTDATAMVMERAIAELREEHPDRADRVTVIAIDRLPAGWLGKNHALDLGAKRATGELVLFCDADIHLSHDCLRRAVAHFERERLDHLSLLFHLWSRSAVVDAFIPYFGQNFLLYFRPWDAKDPTKPDRFMGIGAFNLLRRSALAQVDFLERLPLRPDDDVKLGKVIKQAGFRQDCLSAPEFGSVEWYPSLRACTHGLEKNLFVGADFRKGVILAGSLACFVQVLLPLGLGLFGSAEVAAVSGAGVALEFFVAALATRTMGADSPGPLLRRTALLPLSALLYGWLMVRTTIKNLREGGIYWRDTFYSLEEIRKNRV